MAVSGYAFDSDPVIRLLLQKGLLQYDGVKKYDVTGKNPAEWHTSLNSQLKGDDIIFVPIQEDIPMVDSPQGRRVYPEKVTIVGHQYKITDLKQANEVLKVLYAEEPIRPRGPGGK